MKILLFGKTGQIGSELVKLTDIVGYNREELDITDFTELKKIVTRHQPDVVINATAYHVLPECENNPDKAFAVNAVSLKIIADICNEKNIRLVHFSTSYVFDGTKETPYTETDRPNPLQIYGISKLAGEQIVLQYCKTGIVIRTCAVFGGKTGSRSKKGNFILNILDQARGKKELEVSSEQIISPSYAVDVAIATLALLDKKDISGIYNISNTGTCSWAELAQETIKNKKRKTKIIPVDRGGMVGALRRPLNSAMFNKRAAQLGITLPPWQDAIKRYIISLNE